MRVVIRALVQPSDKRLRRITPMGVVRDPSAVPETNLRWKRQYAALRNPWQVVGSGASVTAPHRS